jgi:tRNA(Arg) A34 adenosine deaminase TadA
MIVRELRLTYPVWVFTVADLERAYATREERMALAIALARANIEHEWGGPFGAAVFESESGRLVSIGVNSVLRMANSLWHAEVMALAMAHTRHASYTLAAPGLPPHELVTSCEPCAMCLGATLWSGVRSLICGATREDAESLGFDEGPVTDASYAYLASRGIGVERGVQREAARKVFEEYRARGGVVYNG